MAYKMKPNKAALARFKFSKTGKVKRHHALTSHLMSARSSATKRRLSRPAVMSETHAGNIRKMVGLQARNPNRTRHFRELAMKAKAEGQATEKK
jgi:large subunit ribosomal protein L35